MLVRELIMRLEKLPEDANVTIPGAQVERVYIDKNGSVMLSAYEDVGEAKLPDDD